MDADQVEAEPLASSHMTGYVDCKDIANSMEENNKEDGEVFLANRGRKEKGDRAERP